jgi:hypothetical protein
MEPLSLSSGPTRTATMPPIASHKRRVTAMIMMMVIVIRVRRIQVCEKALFDGMA